MIDNRFFNKKEFVTMSRICEMLQIKLPKNTTGKEKITDIATLQNATRTEITFFHNIKYLEELSKTKAFACVITKEHAGKTPSNTLALIVDEPYYAHAILLNEFYSIKKNTNEHYISPNAKISPKANIEHGCYISDNVSIADDVIIKKGTYIGCNTTILNGVEIGENSYIESNATIGFAVIGKNAYIKSGARIGQQGFGFHVGSRGVTDVMQIGIVVIGDDVQIGANCTIDRGSMNNTIIGSHSRIDNLVHIAHNVEIGQYCIIAAQSGIAGSTVIGNQCVLGGQVGIAGHLTIGDKVTIAAQSGVMRTVESNRKIAGSPATNVLDWHKQTIALQRLTKRG